MATTNITVYDTWTKVVDSGKEFTLTVSTSYLGYLEIAAVDTDIVPTVKGHRVKSPEESMNRSLIGPGYVYARAMGTSGIQVVVSVWNP